MCKSKLKSTGIKEVQGKHENFLCQVTSWDKKGKQINKNWAVSVSLLNKELLKLIQELILMFYQKRLQISTSLIYN